MREFKSNRGAADYANYIYEQYVPQRFKPAGVPSSRLAAATGRKNKNIKIKIKIKNKNKQKVKYGKRKRRTSVDFPQSRRRMLTGLDRALASFAI